MPQSLNLLHSSPSTLISKSEECLKSIFRRENKENSSLELRIFIFWNVEWKALIQQWIGIFQAQFWVKLCVFFLIFLHVILDFNFKQYISQILWLFNVHRVGLSRSQSDFWHTIRSKSEFGLGLGPPRSRFGSVLTSVSLDHEYAYVKRDKYINVH